MRNDIKSIVYDLFQWLIVLSIPFIICFYWPMKDERLMKFICLQTFTMILLTISFLFTPKRVIYTFYPALILILGFLNLFTHGMSDYVNVGVSFILPTVIGIYIISNHLHTDYIPIVKKTVVLMCLANCLLFFVETLKFQIVFNLDQGWERPSGFMCYPASFALLCGVSLFLAWGWKKWLCIPIGLCLLLTKEYSVILGLIIAVCMPFLNRWWHYTLTFIILGIIGYHFWPQIHGKMIIRLKYLYPVIQNVWARPIDGWGVGMYNRLPDSFFGFPRGNWSEMHCEPLDLFFSMGFIGIACVGGWICSVRNMAIKYKMIFIVFGTMAFFHSPFHFSDTLWLFVILYSLYEIENNEQPT